MQLSVPARHAEARTETGHAQCFASPPEELAAPMETQRAERPAAI